MGQRKIALDPAGLRLDGRHVPLLSGSVHYWRLKREDWARSLDACKAMGLTGIDIYVPWAIHESADQSLDFGKLRPELDVAAFLRMVHERGMLAIVRPGPHINAELTHFGLPDRIIWDTECQARSPAQRPVMLPMVPVAFPVPSYASERFLGESERYLQAVAAELGPLAYPNGPIVLLQIDNEGALYFRDGAYDQDYHPDSLRKFCAFLSRKYKTIEALNAAYGLTDGVRLFEEVNPPTRFSKKEPLSKHLDWAEFHEHLLHGAFARMRKALATSGFEGVPTMHNLPVGQEATPLNAARLHGAVDFVGLDYYYAPSERARRIIARRTTEVAVRGERQGLPSFACEMGAGYPPFFPPLDPSANAFTVLCALAYGLRGYNLYMAVERDRWIGAPIDSKGELRASATFWSKLNRAMLATNFAALRRAVPVRLVMPRSERRLARVMHAFGPLTGAFVSVLGGGAREACMEDDLGLGHPIAMEADVFLSAWESALDARGVPFAFVGGEDRDTSFGGAQWLICGTNGGMQSTLHQCLVQAAAAGAAVTVGPQAPAFDPGFVTREPWPVPEGGLPEPGAMRLMSTLDPSELDRAVAHAVERLSLPTLGVDPDGVFATLHEDTDGNPRVMMLINPLDGDRVARASLTMKRGHVVDVLTDERFSADGGSVEVHLPGRSVRMLSLHPEGAS